MKKIIYTILILGIIGSVIVTSLYFGYLRFNYPSESEYPINGIDVSHHQNEIDWKLVKEQKIRFVFIKATEGGDFIDKRFNQNWKEAKENGIDVGAYHFFTFCRAPQEQAKNFINVVPKIDNSLPPVIDLEFGGNCRLRKSRDSLIKDIKIFEEIIYTHYQKKPILYITQDFYNAFLLNEFKDNPIWARDIYKKPELKDKREWMFWQYGNRGHLKGIDMYVDLNVFNGNKEAYKKLKTGHNTVYK
ncbi:glycoside hydrolase family 25 protein [Flagellimonas sp. HMM57]|uniref:glycoside hydrolase family 25 protein n=1 Tax=unclassified Flagellimonas TaxID=2644544 RepID=UPI0013D18C30|nr:MULTISPECIES: GH25 family lysozyme [unclassified Flagellimonas]UII76232.1 glycoside hydrolase family 25 protein [Flagellimonas sp. HMM57]